MRAVGRTGAFVALAVATALIAVGCGETVIDDAKTEAVIEQNLERATDRKVVSVDCPSGVEVAKGATFECAVSFVGGERETATLKILNDDADVALTDLRPGK
jgi:NAD(P)H-hydrate repair Nnr-like enzyme with NAD(P)H-hydrate epimerase domain